MGAAENHRVRFAMRVVMEYGGKFGLP